MKPILVVAIRWQRSPINPLLVDTALNAAGDWIRFNAETWFLATDQSAGEISGILHRLFTSQDNWMVLPLAEGAEGDGWAPQWIWQWFQDQAEGRPATIPTETQTVVSIPRPPRLP